MVVRFALACLVLSILSAFAPAAAPPTSRPSQGHLVTADGKPVAGATVWVISEMSFQKPRIVTKTASKSDGSFDLPAQPDATDENTTLHVVVRADGFGVCGASRTFDLTMPASTTLRVKLHRPDGTPAAGIKIAPRLLVNLDGSAGVSWFAQLSDELLPEFAVVSDAEGIATVPNMPQGARATLQVLDESYAQCDYRESIIVPKTPDASIAPIHLLAAGVIEGRVLDANGKPLAGVYVGAQGVGASAPAGGTAYTDEQGHYALKQIRAGTFNVALGLPGEFGESWTAVAFESLQLTEGQHLADKDFHLIPGTLVTGKLTDGEGKPLAGLHIGVYGPAHPKSSGWVQNTKTAADGTYRLRVPAGKQYVYFQDMVPEGYLPPQPQSHDVTTTDTKNATADFILRQDPSAPLAGRVVDAVGKPVPQAVVTLERPANDPTTWMSRNTTKTTDDQGRFRFAAVPAGSKLLAAKDKAGTLKPVPVGDDDQEITLTIQDGYLTRLTGVVTDTDGKPIPGAKVSLTRMEGQLGIGTEPRPTDAQGRYSFDNLAIDGQYDVSAYAKGYGEAQSDVHLKPGDSNEAPALKLAKADSFVAGKVLDAKGQPAAGVKVYLMTNESERPESITDAAGAFRFNEVVSGNPVTVYVMNPDGESLAGDANAKPGTSDAVVRLRAKP